MLQLICMFYTTTGPYFLTTSIATFQNTNNPNHLAQSLKRVSHNSFFRAFFCIVGGKTRNFSIFEMAAMPFALSCWFTLMCFNKYASCSIPYSNLCFYFIGDGLSLASNNFLMVHSYCVTSSFCLKSQSIMPKNNHHKMNNDNIIRSNMIHKKGKEKKEISNN